MAPRPDNRAFSALTGDALPPRAAPSVASAVAALTTLGTGFLTAPANRRLRARLREGRLSVMDYYRQLQRLIFRWLVLLVAEERTNEAGQNLLHPVDTSPAVRMRYARQHALGRLRDLAGELPLSSSRADAGHAGHDLFRSLERLTVRMHAGDRPLGLPAMQTFLFSAEASPELDQAVLPDAVLLAALRHLCFSDDPARMDEGHRSPMDFGRVAGEQFGSLHEALLQLRPRIDHDRRQFSLGPADGHERGATGSYYTPTTLVHCLLDSALEPMIQRALSGAKRGQAERALLGLRVCDPACGSGHFLIGAANRLAQHLARLRCGRKSPGPLDLLRAKRDVIGRCLYGVDLNPLAVELCKASLWMEANEPGQPLGFLAPRIQCGNSLLGVTPEHLASGIPDEAFAPIAEDDRQVCRDLRSRNRQERIVGRGEKVANANGARRSRSAPTSPDRTELTDAQLAADAWCSVFAWRKDATELGRLCPTEADFRNLQSDPKRLDPTVCREVERIRDEHRFFHWHLAFAEVFRPNSDDDPPGKQQPGGKDGKDGKKSVGGGFDVVLGNPPYSAESGNAARKLCKYLWQPAAETSNTAADFLVLSRRLLKAGGQAALILPKSLTYSHAWRTIRRLHLPEVTSVIDASRAWRDVRLEQVLLSFGGQLPVRTIACGRIVDHQVRWNRCVDHRTLDRLDILPTGLVDEDVELLEQLLDEEVATLGSVCSTRRGTNVQRFRHPEGDVPLLRGRDIGPFAIHLRLAGLRGGDVPAARLHYAEPGQVVFQNIVAHLTVPADHIWLTGAIIRERVACLDTVNLLRLHSPNANAPTHSSHGHSSHGHSQHGLTPHALCGLLMSDLVNWFVHVGVYNRAIRTMHFDGYFLDKIPMPPAACFRSLHEAAWSVHAQPDGCQAWTALNSVVFDAFRVPRRLADYVTGSRRPRWKARRWTKWD